MKQWKVVWRGILNSYIKKHNVRRFWQVMECKFWEKMSIWFGKQREREKVKSIINKVRVNISHRDWSYNSRDACLIRYWSLWQGGLSGQWKIATLITQGKCVYRAILSYLYTPFILLLLFGKEQLRKKAKIVCISLLLAIVQFVTDQFSKVVISW